MAKDGTRLFREHRAREKFQRKLEQLRFELRIESPRRVLDYLLEHAEDLLGECGDTLLAESFRTQLARARHEVSQRHNLRLVSRQPVRWSEQPQRMLDAQRRFPLPSPEPPKGAA